MFKLTAKINYDEKTEREYNITHIDSDLNYKELLKIFVELSESLGYSENTITNYIDYDKLDK